MFNQSLFLMVAHKDLSADELNFDLRKFESLKLDHRKFEIEFLKVRN